jgi:hypothetical protein
LVAKLSGCGPEYSEVDIPPVPTQEAITFSVTGDYPYNIQELALFHDHVDLHNRYSPSKFFVHVGDIKAGAEECREARYVAIASAVRRLLVPAFILPGDNEWIDCPDVEQAWAWWSENFLDLEDWWEFPLERQKKRPENWVFLYDGVLFIAVNMAAGSEGNETARMIDNIDWIEEQMQKNAEASRSAVVFGHSGPGSGSNDFFFDSFQIESAEYGKPVLYIQGNLHIWLLDQPWPEKNITRLVVDRGSFAPPVQITVNFHEESPWEFVRDPWPEE